MTTASRSVVGIPTGRSPMTSTRVHSAAEESRPHGWDRPPARCSGRVRDIARGGSAYCVRALPVGALGQGVLSMMPTADPFILDPQSQSGRRHTLSDVAELEF